MIKPILFNTEMVRAILEGRKTVTRRVVKPQPERVPIPIPDEKYWLGCFAGDDKCRAIKPPYRPGDILYVRETFCRQSSEEYPFVYKASVETPAAWKWCPSIHMPREAARIFLRVTDVRGERLMDITPEQAIKEGVIDPEHRPYIQYEQVGQLEQYARNNVFPKIWSSTIKPADRSLYGWKANPWVWVIGFERISREEAMEK